MSPRPGERLEGLLGVIKPPGMTSHDVVNVARRVLATRRIGHAGTLDPLAAGVLPILVGSATRLAAVLLALPKTYRAELLFGVSSDTGDLAGQLTSGPVPDLEAGAVRAAVGRLAGRRVQAPPAYSARQVGGRRLYALARAGELSLEHLAAGSREITIFGAELLSLYPTAHGRYAGYPAAAITVACSSGTYVRQLAEEVGRDLGTTACLSFLVRTVSANLTLGDCVTLEQLQAAGNGSSRARCSLAWHTPAEAVAFLPGAVLDSADADRVMHGVSIPAAPGPRALPAEGGPVAAAGITGMSPNGGMVRLLGEDGALVALARLEGQVLRPLKVFAGGEEGRRHGR